MSHYETNAVTIHLNKDCVLTKREDGRYLPKVGDIVEGEITGVTSFGAFIRFDEGLEGLIHISEMDSENPEGSVKLGEKVKARIVNISNSRVYLSLRGLEDNSSPEKALSREAS